MFDVMDRGVWTIAALIVAIAAIGWIFVSLDLAIGIIAGVVVARLILRFWPGIIELFV